jgi:magnesium transporter
MRQIIQGQKITWVDIQDPTQDDVNFLKQELNLPQTALEELIPQGHGPRIECRQEYLFITLYYPMHSAEKRETRSRELDIIVTKETVVTSHYRSIVPLKSLFDNCNLYQENKQKYLQENTGILLFYILSEFWKNCQTKLIRIDKRMNQIERNIFKGKEKEMVVEISYVKTDIINFWRIIDPQKEVLDSLIAKTKEFFGHGVGSYLADAKSAYSQTRNTLQTYRETILALEKTNESLLSTKTNEIIKILTIFSVIMLPLGFIANLWGMNVPLPLIENENGFLVIAGIMIIMVAFMFIYFKKKRWL